MREQAVKWAIRLAKIRKKKNPNAKPILNIYELDETVFHILSIKNFENYSLDWLDAVVSCRKDARYVHGFDIMMGKIADDDVGETVQAVIDGLTSKEFALNKLTFMPANNQICFNTAKSLEYLNFIGYEIC